MEAHGEVQHVSGADREERSAASSISTSGKTGNPAVLFERSRGIPKVIACSATF